MSHTEIESAADRAFRVLSGDGLSIFKARLEECIINATGSTNTYGSSGSIYENTLGYKEIANIRTALDELISELKKYGCINECTGMQNQLGLYHTLQALRNTLVSLETKEPGFQKNPDDSALTVLKTFLGLRKVEEKPVIPSHTFSPVGGFFSIRNKHIITYGRLSDSLFLSNLKKHTQAVLDKLRSELASTPAPAG